MQQGIIQHIQTHSQSHYPNDNVLMMSVELGMANEYVRQLSENTARGLRQKARRGEFPSFAPIGYINNPSTKKIEVHKDAKVVKKLFELYATGKVNLKYLALFMEKSGLKSRKNNRCNQSRISAILTNPIYYGHFRHAGELYEGNHKPIITKALFDKANTILHSRNRRPDKEINSRPLCGLLHCGVCNMSITGEIRIKRQRNGNTHRYVYYHCSKKSKKLKCPEPCIREEELDRQLSVILGQYAMPKEWTTELFSRLEKEESKANVSATSEVNELRRDVEEFSNNLKRLTDVYVAQDIDREEYLERRRTLLSEKKTLEEQIIKIERTPSMWIEPVREWIKDAQTLDEIAKSADLPSKKLSLQKIFGSNLHLTGREASGNPLPHYAELRSARENFNEKCLTLIAEPPLGFEPRTFALQKRCSTN